MTARQAHWGEEAVARRHTRHCCPLLQRPEAAAESCEPAAEAVGAHLNEQSVATWPAAEEARLPAQGVVGVRLCGEAG